jgi:hypothetical protein
MCLAIVASSFDVAFKKYYSFEKSLFFVATNKLL